jgi:hypothetical protein
MSKNINTLDAFIKRVPKENQTPIQTNSSSKENTAVNSEKKDEKKL